MILSLAAGAVADLFDRRRVLLIAQGFMLAVSVALAAFTYAGVITPWLLLTFTFLIGCGNAFNRPAWQSSVGEMVPREDLAGAVALNSMGFNVARSVGPAFGGIIVAAAGEDLFVNAGTTATLSGVTAGDDLTVEAAGAISVTNSGTTGAGADGREIFYAPCCSNPLFFVLQTADVDPDGSNVTLTSSGGNVIASDISAFNALTATAAGTLAGTGLLQAGGDIRLVATGAVNIADATAGNSLTIDAASIGFGDLSAGDDAGLFATGAIAGGTITTGADIQITGASIAVDGIESGGSLAAQATN
jgi:MFS family permease